MNGVRVTHDQIKDMDQILSLLIKSESAFSPSDIKGYILKDKSENYIKGLFEMMDALSYPSVVRTVADTKEGKIYVSTDFAHTFLENGGFNKTYTEEQVKQEKAEQKEEQEFTKMKLEIFGLQQQINEFEPTKKRAKRAELISYIVAASAVITWVIMFLQWRYSK